MPKKGERLGQFVSLREGVWQEKGAGVFDTPMHTMRVVQNLKRKLFYFFGSKLTKTWWILIWTRKSLKNCPLIGPFCAKYTTFDLKMYKWIYLMTLKSHDLWFGKWIEEFSKFSSEHLKKSKLVFLWDLIVQSRKCMSYKLIEEL